MPAWLMAFVAIAWCAGGALVVLWMAYAIATNVVRVASLSMIIVSVWLSTTQIASGLVAFQI